MANDDNEKPKGYRVERTDEFDEWLDNLRDIRAKSAIHARILRIEQDGFFGDTKGVGDKVSEIHFFYWGGLPSLLYHYWRYGGFYVVWWR